MVSAWSRGMVVIGLGQALGVPAVAQEPQRVATVTPADREPWIEGRSAHFTFYASTSREVLNEVVQNLETLHACMQRLPFGGEGRSAGRTLVFVFKDEVAFRDYREREEVSGWFIKAPEANYIALPWSQEDTRRIVFHEYTHFAMHQRYPGIPNWLDEGMAELYSHLRVEGSRVRLGEGFQRRYDTLSRSGLIPLGTFLSMDNPLHTQGSSNKVAQYYSQSWLLAHFLVMGRKDHPASLQVFIRYLQEGMPQGEAIHKAFGLSVEALDKELRTYYDALQTEQRIPVQVVEFPGLGVAAGATVSPMDWDLIQARLGLLAMRVVERKDLAERHFRAALARNPRCAEANMGLGRLLISNGQDSEGYRHLLLAAEDFREDADLQWLLGSRLYQEAVTGKELDAGKLVRAQNHVLQHLRLSPGHAASLDLLRQSLRWDPPSASGLQVELEQSRMKEPSRWEWAALLAFIQVERQQIEGALPLLKLVASQASDAKVVKEAKDLIAEAEDQAGREGLLNGLALIREGRTVQARTVLSRALAVAKGRDLQSRIQSLLKMAEFQGRAKDRDKSPHKPGPGSRGKG